MKYLVVAASLLLSGCATGPVTTVQVPGIVQPVSVSQIQAIAQGICGFVPDAASVIGLMGVHPAIETAVGIAQTICAAVGGVAFGADPSAAPRKVVWPKVRGVTISGHFAK